MQDNARQPILEQLRNNRERIAALVEPLSPEQWNFKPAPDRWSIHEVLEHVVVVENRVLGIIQQKTEGQAESYKRSAVEDEMLLAAVPNRETRRQAPEIAHPTGQWPGRQVAEEFEKCRTRTCDFAAWNQKDLRQYFHTHGAFGELDCHQLMMLLSLHGERHARQIEEVQATPGYPQSAAATA
jgi:hypothetical protein